MKMHKNGLDEMQKERRNGIGNSMFLVLAYALLLDGGLYGMGVRWLDYPANTMVIMSACMGIYLVRIIAANAYLPPDAQKRKHLLIFKVAVVLCIAVAAAALYIFANASGQLAAGDVGDNSAMILFLVASVGLVISLIVALIKRANDKKDNDE